MGLDVRRDQFAAADFTRFSERLEQGLMVLAELMSRQDFGVGPMSFGAELEMFLVDEQGTPKLVNQQVLRSVGDECFTVELDRFNIECNTRPTLLSHGPFSALLKELQQRTTQLQAAAAQHGARVVQIGVLPTLDKQHFHSGVMTNVPRYRALSRLLRERRTEPFRLRIDGQDPLDIEHDNVTFEGATTSLQLHLRTLPERFAALYNAAQMATAPALAASGNSPLLLGHRLWEETRVALFKQAVDERHPEERSSGARPRQPRVSFGQRWVRNGAFELFEENVRQFEPILPVLGSEEPAAVLAGGGVPTLSELRLHNGTVWRWNRPVYDPAEGGHLRIEMRALPAGPTLTDMVANAAFLVGATLALSEQPDWVAGVPFAAAEDNFYRAARFGLQASLQWPGARGLEQRSAAEVARALLEPAAAALGRAGVPVSDFEPYLKVFEQRLLTGQTGARWLRQQFDDHIAGKHVAGDSVEPALRKTLERYTELSATGNPVHEWPQ